MSAPKPQLPPIDQVARALELPEADAAEAQGLLCGLVCILGDEVDPRGWRDQVMDGQPQKSEERDRMLQRLFDATVAGLFDEELGLRLLLPPDNTHLGRRTECLGGWCEGFLLGLGLGGVSEGTSLPEATSEIIGDLSQIARAGLESAEANEEQENAYAQVVEYVRMGVLLVYDELAPLRDLSTDSTVH